MEIDTHLDDAMEAREIARMDFRLMRASGCSKEDVKEYARTNPIADSLSRAEVLDLADEVLHE